MAAAALAATAWAIFGVLSEDPPALLPPIRLTFPTPAGVDLGAGDDLLDAAISPDERHIVFVATTSSGPMLWLRALAADDARPLPGTDGAAYPAWKRGGGAISFFAGGKLRQIALADGEIRDLADVASPRGATWFNDGSLVFGGAPGPLKRLRRGEITDATTLRPGDREHLFPFSSNGEGFSHVAVRDDGSRIIRLAGTGSAKLDMADLATTSSHGQLVGDQVLHVRDGALLASRLDARTSEITGRAAPVATSIAESAAGHAGFAASTRLLVTVAATPRIRELAWFDQAGAALGAIGEPGDYWQVRLSPDDRHAAVTMVDPLMKALDVMTMPTDRPGDRQKLTLALAADTDPVWSPDGSRVIFRSLEDGLPAIFFRRALDPEAPIEPGRAGDDTPTDWRDGRVLVTSRKGSSLDVHALDERLDARTPIAATGFNESDARWSPDGRWVAFVSDESGQPDIYAIQGGARTRVSFGGGTKPRWSADGQSLFLVRGDQILRAGLVGRRFTPPQPVATIAGLHDLDTAHRSRRLLVLRATDGPPVRATAVIDWQTPLAAAQAPPPRR
jgi:hypothetical protein